jgi:hypothetical protein
MAAFAFLLAFAGSSGVSANLEHTGVNQQHSTIHESFVPLRRRNHAEPVEIVPDATYNNFDISSYGTCEKFMDFSGYYNSFYGYVSAIPDSVSYKEVEKVIYKSNWAPWQSPITKPYHDRRYQTFTFDTYLNLPIRIIDRIALEPNQSMQYQQTEIEEATYTASKTVEKGCSVTNSFNQKSKINFGAEIKLDLIKLSGEISWQNEIGVSNTFYTSVSVTRSETVRMLRQVTQTWNLDNSGCNEHRVFQLNYRQQFKLYFTTEYEYLYDVTRKGSGTWNRDDNYTYSLRGYKAVRTVYFLLPVNLPTFGFTQYHNDCKGNEVTVYQKENKVIYL